MDDRLLDFHCETLENRCLLATLAFSMDSGVVHENASRVATVTRDGTAGALTVALSTNDTTEIGLPASVVIPSGQTSASFVVQGKMDGIVDGNQNVLLIGQAAGYFPAINWLTVTDYVAAPQATLSLNVASSTISEVSTTAATVTRTSSTGDLVVRVTASDHSEVTIPSSIVIPHGQLSRSFTIQGKRDHQVDGAQSVQVAVAAAGHTGATKSLSVSDVDLRAMTIALDATSLAENGSLRTIITRDTTIGNQWINLAVSDASELSVPSGVWIPHGQQSATVTVHGVADGIHDGDQSVLVIGYAAGYYNALSWVTVTDTDVAALSLDLASSAIMENGTTTGTISRSGTTGTVNVNLTSSNPSEATLPATVQIPHGQTSATFTIQGVSDGMVDGTKSVVIDATAASYMSDSKTLNVSNSDYGVLSISTADATISEDGSTTATVTRNGILGDLWVNIGTYDDEVDVPNQVLISDGQSSATFTVTGKRDGQVDGDQNVLMIAHATGHSYGIRWLTVTNADPGFLNVSASQLLIAENGYAIGTVTRNSTFGSLNVTLSTDDSTEFYIPATVTIPNGQTTATFMVTGLVDGEFDGNQLATIVAEASGYHVGQTWMTVSNIDVGVLSLTVASRVIDEKGERGETTVTVTRNGEEGNLPVKLSTSDLSEVGLPAGVWIPHGQTSASFQLRGVDDDQVDGAQWVSVTASSDGLSSATTYVSVADTNYAPAAGPFYGPYQIEDAMVYSGAPYTNYGNSEWLVTGPGRAVYLNIALDRGRKLEQLHLDLRSLQALSEVPTLEFKIGQAWTDSSITWANQPTGGYAPGPTGALSARADGTSTVSYDVTQPARRALLLGDADFDGDLDIASDVLAFEQAIRDPARFYDEFGLAVTDAEVLLRMDANADGVVNASDATHFFDAHGALLADVDQNGLYDHRDTSRVTANYGTGTRYSQGDLNFDGSVDIHDLNLLGQTNTGARSTGPPAASLSLRLTSNGPTSFHSTESSSIADRPAIDVQSDAPPATPANLESSVGSAPDGSLGVQLNWAPALGADHYVIERESADGQWFTIGLTDETEFLDAAVKQGRGPLGVADWYRYRVSAVNANGRSAYRFGYGYVPIQHIQLVDRSANFGPLVVEPIINGRVDPAFSHSLSWEVALPDGEWMEWNTERAYVLKSDKLAEGTRIRARQSNGPYSEPFVVPYRSPRLLLDVSSHSPPDFGSSEYLLSVKMLDPSLPSGNTHIERAAWDGGDLTTVGGWEPVASFGPLAFAAHYKLPIGEFRYAYRARNEAAVSNVVGVGYWEHPLKTDPEWTEHPQMDAQMFFGVGKVKSSHSLLLQAETPTIQPPNQSKSLDGQEYPWDANRRNSHVSGWTSSGLFTGPLVTDRVVLPSEANIEWRPMFDPNTNTWLWSPYFDSNEVSAGPDATGDVNVHFSWQRTETVTDLDPEQVIWPHVATSSQTLSFTVLDLNLAIDTNNDGTIDGNDAIEDRELWSNDSPGHVMLVADKDSDGDGLLDWQDGFDWDSTTTDDNTSVGSKFVPMQFHLPTSVDLNQMGIEIIYSASPPNLIPTNGLAYKPDDGHIRLWRKDGDQARSLRSTREGGDYVDPGFYTAAELGITSANAQLFIEPVAPHAGTITVRVHPDGDRSSEFVSDYVRYQASRIEVRHWNDGSTSTQPHLATTDLTRLYNSVDRYEIVVYDGRDDLTHVMVDDVTVPIETYGYDGSIYKYRSTRPVVFLNQESADLLAADEAVVITSKPTYEFGYYGLQLPDATDALLPWSVGTSGGPDAFLLGDNLVIESSDVDIYSVELTDPEYWKPDRATEIGVSFLLMDTIPTSGLGLRVGDGSQTWDITVGANAITWTFDGDDYELGYGDNLADGSFHGLSFTLAPGSSQLAVHVDGAYLGTVTSDESTFSGLAWGDLGPDHSTNAEIGAVWWHHDNTSDPETVQFSQRPSELFTANDVIVQVDENSVEFETTDAKLHRDLGIREANDTDPNQLQGVDVSSISGENIWRGAQLMAEGMGLPTLLIDWNRRNKTAIRATPGTTSYAVFWNIINFGDEVQAKRFDRIARVGKFNKATDRGTLGSLYNEAFHAYYDQFIEEQASATWLRHLMNKQMQYPRRKRIEMTEEAMSETIDHVIRQIENRRRVLTYQEIITREPTSISPLHNGPHGRFRGIPSANAPMTEDLYYGTLWVLENGTTDPMKGQAIGAKLIDVLKEHYRTSAFYHPNLRNNP